MDNKEFQNLIDNMSYDECRKNAKLLAQYIQTIEETKPNSNILPEAYSKLSYYKKRIERYRNEGSLT